MGLKLGFYYHVPAAMRDGSIVMPGYQGCFVDSLAAHCEKLTCFLHSPTPHDHFSGDYSIHSAKVELVDIGPHASVLYRTLYARRYVHPFVTHRNELDLLLLRGPSPLLPDFARVAGHLPLALLLVGDYLSGVDDLPQQPWRRELIRLWSRWNHKCQLNVARHSLTFVNSHVLYEQLKPHVTRLVETRTTTLSQSDFYERQDTCQAPPYHLLYTGRMDRAKGISEMVSVLALLVERGYDCTLDLVGMAVEGDPILDEIHQQAAQLGLSGRVIYHGYKPLGKELFYYYRKADIYIVASKSSFEGFPRTIWEAMANSLPVVATRVGSIPDFIEKAAVLVEPNDVEALACAVISLLNDKEMRRKNIQVGHLLAQQNTLENLSLQMISHIQAYLTDR